MLDELEADMREKIISLAEENQKLKTEIEKIKLDYIGRAVKLHKALKRSADLAHKKEFQCLNCWRCKSETKLKSSPRKRSYNGGTD